EGAIPLQPSIAHDEGHVPYEGVSRMGKPDGIADQSPGAGEVCIEVAPVLIHSRAEKATLGRAIRRERDRERGASLEPVDRLAAFGGRERDGAKRLLRYVLAGHHCHGESRLRGVVAACDQEQRGSEWRGDETPYASEHGDGLLHGGAVVGAPAPGSCAPTPSLHWIMPDGGPF